jgi:Fe2+ or Zn2+ uptake regulation protein
LGLLNAWIVQERSGKIKPKDFLNPSVKTIYEEGRATFPTTSLATIYKTVSLLREMNEVLELGFADGSNRYDGYRPFPQANP